MLSNRVAVVTGGARGIGGAIALKYADEGCSLVIADLREKEGEQTLEEITTKGSKGIFVECDHTNSLPTLSRKGLSITRKRQCKPG